MPQICKVCTHPDRQTIDAELSRSWGRSLRAMGAEFGLSKDSLFRHANSHLLQTPEESEPRQAAEVIEKRDKNLIKPEISSRACASEELRKEEAEAIPVVEPIEERKATAPNLLAWTPEQVAAIRQGLAKRIKQVRRRLVGRRIC